MSDLTLKEALTQYRDECREILGESRYDIFYASYANWEEWRMALIGYAVTWLSGEMVELQMDVVDGVLMPSEPLQFFLGQVRQHMEATK